MSLKEIVRATLRWLATPLRRRKARRYARSDGHAATMQLPNDVFLGLVVSEMRRTGKTATIIVKGYSMRPFVEHLRDTAVLALPTPDGLRLHDVVLAEVAPGVYVLHRIVAIDGDRLTLMGDGNIGLTEHCRRGDVRAIATAFIRPDGTTLHTDDPAYQRRVRRWLRLQPLRRWLLFFYKLTV